MCNNRDAIKSKGTRHSALVQWDDGYIFKLTLLAHVKFPPHKPYIVTTFTHNMNLLGVRKMGKGFPGGPRTQHCKTRG